MRVISGQARGRRLVAPDAAHVRPTGDRVREALFNSLEARVGVAGSAVVDLFAGSGALGIEAWSRGADPVVCVERDRRCLATIRDNLAALGADVVVVDDDVLRWARRTSDRFDVAVADPPYEFDAWEELLAVVPARLVVAESDRSIGAVGPFVVERTRRHGRTWLTTLAARDETPPGCEGGWPR